MTEVYSYSTMSDISVLLNMPQTEAENTRAAPDRLGAQKKLAEDFALCHRLPLVEGDLSQIEGRAVVFHQNGISLCIREGTRPLCIDLDFTSGALAHRRHFGGGRGQAIAKAVGLRKSFTPTVLDMTAGLGRDAFVLACLGAQVTMIERSPFIQLLLEQALIEARLWAQEHADHELQAIFQRMVLVKADSAHYLQNLKSPVDVIYLDPMFPMRKKKSALVKKEMRVFQQFVGEDVDSEKLLALALEKARFRVVVKRPKIAEPLAALKPALQLTGKSSRFDIYPIRAIPQD